MARALPVQPIGVTMVDRSGSIAAAGASQVLMTANASRLGWFIQNTSTGDLWVNDMGNAAVAASPSIRVPAGSLYETPAGVTTMTAITVIGSVAGQTYTAREY